MQRKREGNSERKTEWSIDGESKNYRERKRIRETERKRDREIRLKINCEWKIGKESARRMGYRNGNRVKK